MVGGAECRVLWERREEWGRGRQDEERCGMADTGKVVREARGPRWHCP